MHSSRFRQIFFFLFCCAIIIASFLFIFPLFKKTPVRVVQQPKKTAFIETIPTLAPTPNQTGYTCHTKTGQYEGGFSFPQWDTNGYGVTDLSWKTGLLAMKQQTGACWVEMPLLFHQSSDTSTDVAPGSATPSLPSFVEGVQYAHSIGLHVFVTLLLGTGYAPDPWAGRIHFPSHIEEQTWFDHYFAATKPYLELAQQSQVEQLALGTEEQWIQDHAPDSMWLHLFAQVRTVYHGRLSYDANWSTLFTTPKSWMRSPLLTFLGISEYVPVISTSKYVPPGEVSTLWASTVKKVLLAFSKALGAPILISEVGYRQASDALYQPWSTVVKTMRDPGEQAAACGAVLQNTIGDPHFLGSFFWGWNAVGGMSLQGTVAAQRIASYYEKI